MSANPPIGTRSVRGYVLGRAEVPLYHLPGGLAVVLESSLARAAGISVVGFRQACAILKVPHERRAFFARDMGRMVNGRPLAWLDTLGRVPRTFIPEDLIPLWALVAQDTGFDPPARPRGAA